MFCSEHEAVMTEEEFRLIRDIIYSHCGLFFDSDTKYLLEKRLAKRLPLNQLKDFKEYYHFLKYERRKDQEMSDLMDILTTNETYFFREAFQLKALTADLRRGKNALGIELGNGMYNVLGGGRFTKFKGSFGPQKAIAQIRLEYSDGPVEIIGTDISHRVLQHSRKAVYGKSSFRATEDHYIRSFFHEQDNGNKVNDEVRELVTISHLNLFDQNRLALLGRMDVIFCRNVIIYFDQAAKKKIIESFNRMLHDGGYLLLGHSESLMNISTAFALRHLKNDMVYQKPCAPGSIL